MSDLAQRLEVVRSHPLHRLMGLQGLQSADGLAELASRVEGTAINPAGALHGGVIYTLSDVCAYAAVLGLLTAAEEAVTHDIHVTVMRPAGPGDELLFRAQVVKRGVRLAFIKVVATSGGKELASATVTKSIVPRR